jgi:hypothetical protein
VIKDCKDTKNLGCKLIKKKTNKKGKDKNTRKNKKTTNTGRNT